jgi:hypothetical protein
VRTQKRRGSSSGGHLRSRRDTRGHAFGTVRDREAPGSNPGPPTRFRSSSPPIDSCKSPDLHRHIPLS